MMSTLLTTATVKAVLLVAYCAFLAACGGGGGSSSAVTPPGSTGQAILGPLSGADAEIINLATREIIYTTQTASSNDLSQAGIFTIPAGTVDDQTLYIIRIRGGLDIDADDNGIPDTTPRVNKGEIRLVLEGSRLNRGNFRVSLLTELIYRRMAHLFRPTTEPGELFSQMDRYATAVLTTDINQDGTLDHHDLVAWHPQLHRQFIRNGLAAYQDIISAIHNGNALTISDLEMSDSLLGTSGSGRSRSIEVHGTIAYMADGPLGLNIIDISQADRPVLLGHFDSPGLALDVAIDGDIAYLADAASGLHVIGISDRANPVSLGSLATGGEARGVVMVNGIVYVSDSVAGLLTLDTSNPTSLLVASTLPVNGESLGINTESQYPDRLLLPIRQPNGVETDLVYNIAAAGSVIFEGTLGPDPDNPALERILVRNPTDTPPAGGFTEEPAATNQALPEPDDTNVILEGTLGPEPDIVPLERSTVSNPETGFSGGFQLEQEQLNN